MEHASATEATSESRNIVILCDGTGNEISENISNPGVGLTRLTWALTRTHWR